MKTKKIVVRKIHLDRALKTIPLSTTTCLFAQAAKDAFGEPPKCCGYVSLRIADNSWFIPGEATRLIQRFDGVAGDGKPRNAEEIAALRDELPVEFTVTLNA